MRLSTVLLLLFSLLVTSCSTPLVKPGSFDPEVLHRQPLPAGALHEGESGERELLPDPGWMSDVDPVAHLTFAGYRPAPNHVRFSVVLQCDPAKDRLVLLPLASDETPLEVLLDPDRRKALTRTVLEYATGDQNRQNGPGHGELLYLSLSQVIARKELGPPLPRPRHIFAVALNYPSHLRHDLIISGTDAQREALRGSRARVFLKFPAVPPPGESLDGASVPGGYLGPYDAIRYPARITVPTENEGASRTRVTTRVDYEVEIGAVIGRSLSRETIENASDEELRRAVAGYVLVGDTKARNPQVVRKLLASHPVTLGSALPYRTGVKSLDRALGAWDSVTCQWWSHAASWGDYATVGPLFVASPGDASFPSRGMISARSYGPEADRGYPIPGGRSEGTLYLRQCSRTTEEEEFADSLVWRIPRILRSILAPDNALSFLEEPLQIHPGDIICLGTPGGVVITSKSQGTIDFLTTVIFWRSSLDWHDAFFDRASPLYVQNGDELFFWAEGLGFQTHPVQRIDDDQADSNRP